LFILFFLLKYLLLNFMNRLSKNNKKAFTLLEIILVVALMTILSIIVILAINPVKHLRDTNNAKRMVDIKTISNAITQYVIDNEGVLPEEISTEKREICKTDAVNCLNLSFLTNNNKYLKAIPTDSKEESINGSGYEIFRTSYDGFRVVSPYIEYEESSYFVNQDWLPGFTYRKKITIDNSLIDTNLNNFPILIKLNNSNFDFSKTQVTGNDIRFASIDSQVVFSHEKELYDPLNNEAEYWVKIPSISSDDDTEFFIYYSSESSLDTSAPSSVWSSNYKLVWHLKDLNNSIVADSTSYFNQGNKASFNNPLEVSSLITKGQFFSSNSYITSNPSDSFNLGQSLTLSNWFNCSPFSMGTISSATGGRMINFHRVSPGTTIATVVGSDGLGYYNSGALTFKSDGVNPCDNNWHLATLTLDSSGNLRLYKDGFLVVSGSGGSVSYSNYPLHIGSYDGSSRFFKGTLDEVKISDIARSDAWIKAEYYSEINSLISYGEIEIKP